MGTRSNILVLVCVLLCHEACGQWGQTGGPRGAYVLNIVSDGQNILAGVKDGGVYLSRDYGQTWVWITKEFGSEDGEALAIFDGKLFVGRYRSDTNRTGVFISSDWGFSWKQSLVGIPPNCLAIDRGVIMVGTPHGLFESNDEGISWRVNNSIPKDTDVTAVSIKDSLVLVGTQSGQVFRSFDRGSNWELHSAGLMGSRVNQLLVADTLVFALTGDGFFSSSISGQAWLNRFVSTAQTLAFSDSTLFLGTLYGLLMSKDLGRTWLWLSNDGFPLPTGFALVVSGNRLVRSSLPAGISLSLDNGQSWMTSNSGLVGTSTGPITSNGSRLFVNAIPGGIFESPDGGSTWSPVSPPSSSLDVISLYSKGMALYVGNRPNLGAQFGLYAFSKVDTGWTVSGAALWNVAVNATVLDGANLLVGSSRGFFVRYDSSQTLIQRNDGLPDTSIKAIAIKDKRVFVGTEHGVFVSTNEGVKWSSVNAGPNLVRISKIVVSDTSIYVLGYTTSTGYNTKLVVSGDEGLSWRSIDGLPGLVYDILVIGRNMVAVTHGDMYFSANNDGSWIPIKGSMSAFPTNIDVVDQKLFATTLGSGVWYRPLSDLMSLPSCPNLLLPANSSTIHSQGVAFRWTSLEGSNWFLIGISSSPSFESYDLYEIIVDTSYITTKLTVGKTYYWRVSSSHDGILSAWSSPWSFTMGSPLLVQSDSLRPTVMSLAQNYPNPFNPSTTIKYELPRTSNVNLTVFDILGREVSVLVNERREPGVHEVKFDGSGLASGVYFYKLQAGDFVATKRLLLLK